MAAGRPIKARLRCVGTEDDGRMLWRSGGPGKKGCASASFRLPDDMARVRVKSHEPDFRADITGDGNYLTIDLPSDWGVGGVA